MNVITKDIDFKVSKKPVVFRVKGKYHEVPSKFVTYREDTGEPLGVVGGHYSIKNHIENLKIVGKVLDTISGDYTFEHTLIKGRIISAFSLKSHAFLKKVKNEESVPQVIVQNSYDGSIAFQTDIGVLRLVCGNGQVVISKEIEIIKRRHFGSLDPQVLIDRLPEAINLYTQKYIKFYEYAKAKRIISFDKFQRLPRKLVNDAKTNFMTGKQGSLWNQYNSFTNCITNEKSNPLTKALHNQIVASIFQTTVIV